MSETMLDGGGQEESFTVGGSTRMAPGLGLIGGVIIDQHFAERGRVGRLVGAVAQNPKNIGVGIDEQTAIVLEGGRGFYVLGSGRSTSSTGRASAIPTSQRRRRTRRSRCTTSACTSSARATASTSNRAAPGGCRRGS
jgi:cyanophycinase